MDEFIKICGDNDLTYFAWGGTGIGALRHKGFIPWDDDIDLGMPAQDLEKLTEIIENQFSEKFSIISASTDINYPLPTTDRAPQESAECTPWETTTARRAEQRRQPSALQLVDHPPP